METMWQAASYVAEQVRSRLRAAFGGDWERGALSLEWIVIAVFLVAAGGVAYAFFKGAITAEANKLP